MYRIFSYFLQTRGCGLFRATVFKEILAIFKDKNNKITPE